MEATTDDRSDALVWEEYDTAAWFMALRRVTGTHDDIDALDGISPRCYALIVEDMEAFQERVRGFAYARAMRDMP